MPHFARGRPHRAECRIDGHRRAVRAKQPPVSLSTQPRSTLPKNEQVSASVRACVRACVSTLPRGHTMHVRITTVRFVKPMPSPMPTCAVLSDATAALSSGFGSVKLILLPGCTLVLQKVS